MKRQTIGIALMEKGGEEGMKEYVMQTNDSGIVTKVCEEVIRCKDCKYANQSTVQLNVNYYCEIIEGVHEPGWFCAYGERKE